MELSAGPTKASEDIKEELSTGTAIALFSPKRETKVTADVLALGLGVVL